MSPALCLVALFVSLCLLLCALFSGLALGFALSSWQHDLGKRIDALNRDLIGVEGELLELTTRVDRTECRADPTECTDEADWWKAGGVDQDDDTP